MTQHPEVGASLTMFPCVSRILPSCVVLYQVELRHLLSSQCHNRRRAWRRSRQRIWRGRRHDVFGDSPRGPANPTVVNNRMFWWAALTSRCWFAWVEGAQSLGLVSLTFPVQQLIQNLKTKEGWGCYTSCTHEHLQLFVSDQIQIYFHLFHVIDDPFY